jgi:hypothetical protein
MRVNSEFIVILTLIAIAIPVAGFSMMQFEVGGDRMLVEYARTNPSNPSRTCSGKWIPARKLEFGDRWGYLPSVLRALQIPESTSPRLFKDEFSNRSHIIKAPRALLMTTSTSDGWAVR